MAKVYTSATVPSSGKPLPTKNTTGSNFKDKSIASLSANQAAGTVTILSGNTSRKALMINPPADCFLILTPGATRGYPLFANVPNTLSGADCPTDTLFVSGLSAAATLTIWEA